ncbi:MAG: DUF58 domain-containing protein [Gammaproteobacteria bacterium]
MKPLTLKERFRLDRFFNGEQPIDEPVLLNHRRVFILPSQRGMGFVLLIGLLLLIAFVYNNNLTYLLTFLLASIFFVTILHSFKSLSGLILHAGQCKPVFAGESAIFEIHLENPGNTPRVNIKIALNNTIDLDVPPRSKTSARLFSTTRQRGWHACGTITIYSTYPLGLFRVWSPIRFNLKTLVYPKPSVQEVPFPVSVDSSLPDGSVKQGVDDFYGLQEYQKGDSIKHIHWKAYAKGQGLYSRLYSGEQGFELWLSYETAGGHDVEERLSQLCRWILDAEKASLHYGLSLPGLKIAPGIGQAHRTKCLEALALFSF